MILSCTGCGKSLKVADEHAGRRARCPSCGALVAVPKAGARVAEPAMQMATAGPTAATPMPLPMSQPPGPPPSTSLIPAPQTYDGPQFHTPQSRVAQPYQPPGYQTPSRPQQSYHPRNHPAQGYYPPVAEKDPGIAAILEVIGGMFMQTFGIGHIYAGNVGVGLAFMFGYWFVCFINFLLMIVLVGFLTYPLCWVLFMILSPITAASSVKRY